jgi:hypothetical protein
MSDTNSLGETNTSLQGTFEYKYLVHNPVLLLLSLPRV